MFSLHFFLGKCFIDYLFLYSILPYYYLAAKLILLVASFCSWYYKSHSGTSTHSLQGPTLFKSLSLPQERLSLDENYLIGMSRLFMSDRY